MMNKINENQAKTITISLSVYFDSTKLPSYRS